MISNLVYVLPVFVLDRYEIEGARSTQLRPPDAGLASQEWEDIEAKKYDRFLTLSRFMCMHNNEIRSYSLEPGLEPEKTLIELLWATLDSVSQYTTPAGWGISRWWSTLVNRSIRHGCKVPGWAIPPRSQKFSKLPLHDFCNLYQAGCTNYEKPLPDVVYALQGWLGIPFNGLGYINEAHLPPDLEEKAHNDMREILLGLQEVEARLTGQQGGYRE